MTSKRATILIVDDQASMRELIKRLLGPLNLELATAQDGLDALKRAAELNPDLILLDVNMPSLGGFEVCRRLRAIPAFEETPIVIVTTNDDEHSRDKGFEAGADDYIAKPFHPALLRRRVQTLTRLNHSRRHHAEGSRFGELIDLSPDGIVIVDSDQQTRLVNPAMLRLLEVEQEGEIKDGVRSRSEEVHSEALSRFVMPAELNHCRAKLLELFKTPNAQVRFETTLLKRSGVPIQVEVHGAHSSWNGQAAAQLIIRDITQRKLTEAHLRRSNTELRLAYDTTIEGWARALELRDKETEGHTRRVTDMTVRLARVMGIDDEALVHIRRGALLHDIGKMGVPDHILLKPGKLSEAEWEAMREHPSHALTMLSPITFLRPALEIPYCHHEKWDGSGYPRGLKGEAIPLAARIFSLVDVWDALSYDRPYRRAWSQDKVISYLRERAGIDFDPGITEVFLRMLTKSPVLTPAKQERLDEVVPVSG